MCERERESEREREREGVRERDVIIIIILGEISDSPYHSQRQSENIHDCSNHYFICVCILSLNKYTQFVYV